MLLKQVVLRIEFTSLLSRSTKTGPLHGRYMKLFRKGVPIKFAKECFITSCLKVWLLCNMYIVCGQFYL